jgi:hypothetical protein
MVKGITIHHSSFTIQNSGASMIIIAPLPRRGRRQKAVFGAPPVAQLMLVSASYATFEAVLSFDRAIDVSAFDPTTIFVNDAERWMALRGGEYSLSDPNTVSLSMGEIGDYEGGETTLEASAGNGIVAVDDGAAWGGTEGTGLPFP